MTDLVALRLHHVGISPQCLPLGPRGHDLPDCFLLGLMRDELAAVADAKPKGEAAPEVAAARFLIGLRLADTLLETLSLGSREGCETEFFQRRSGLGGGRRDRGRLDLRRGRRGYGDVGGERGLQRVLLGVVERGPDHRAADAL